MSCNCLTSHNYSHNHSNINDELDLERPLYVCGELTEFETEDLKKRVRENLGINLTEFLTSDNLPEKLLPLIQNYFNENKDNLKGEPGKDGLNGVDGKGIKAIRKDRTEDNKDIYLIVFSDDSIFEFTLQNGTNGIGISALDIWCLENNKTNDECSAEAFFDSLKGEDGKSYEFIYVRTKDNSETSKTAISQIVNLLNEGDHFQISDYPFIVVNNELQYSIENGTKVYTVKLDGITYKITDNPQGVNYDYECEWMLTRVKLSDWKSFSYSIHSLRGEKGRDGDGIEYAYCLSNEPLDWSKCSLFEDGFFTKDYDNNDDEAYENLTGEYIFEEGKSKYLIWTDDPQNISEDYKWQYSSIRKKDHINNIWGKFQTPTLWSHYGENGEDGDNIEYIYIQTKTSEEKAELEKIVKSLNQY